MAEETKTDVTIADVKAPDKDVVKPAWYWVKDTKGYGSVSVTLVFIAFWVTTIAYILSIFSKIGPFTVRPFDVAACSAYLGPILALYGARKFTDAKYGGSDSKD
jgi:hypothetical protein